MKEKIKSNYPPAYECPECGWIGWEKPKGICPRTGKRIIWRKKNRKK